MKKETLAAAMERQSLPFDEVTALISNESAIVHGEVEGSFVTATIQIRFDLPDGSVFEAEETRRFKMKKIK